MVKVRGHPVVDTDHVCYCCLPVITLRLIPTLLIAGNFCFSILSEGCPCSYSEGQVFYVPLTYPDLRGHDGVYGSQSDLFLRGSRLGKAFLSVRSDR